MHPPSGSSARRASKVAEPRSLRTASTWGFAPFFRGCAGLRSTDPGPLLVVPPRAHFSDHRPGARTAAFGGSAVRLRRKPESTRWRVSVRDLCPTGSQVSRVDGGGVSKEIEEQVDHVIPRASERAAQFLGVIQRTAVEEGLDLDLQPTKR